QSEENCLGHATRSRLDIFPNADHDRGQRGRLSQLSTLNSQAFPWAARLKIWSSLGSMSFSDVVAVSGPAFCADCFTCSRCSTSGSCSFDFFFIGSVYFASARLVVLLLASAT